MADSSEVILRSAMLRGTYDSHGSVAVRYRQRGAMDREAPRWDKVSAPQRHVREAQRYAMAYRYNNNGMRQKARARLVAPRQCVICVMYAGTGGTFRVRRDVVETERHTA